ncbi:MAG: alpha/beta hydrolase [Phycicoccus sp.]
MSPTAADRLERLLPEQLRGASAGRTTVVERHAGRQVAVHRWGSDDAAARLVLVHGAGGNGLLLAPFGLAARRTGFAVTAVDLPGYGLSIDRHKATVRYADLVAVAASVLDGEYRRSGQPVVVAGFSIGGRLAVEAAAASGVASHVVATNLLEPTDPVVRPALTRWRWMARLPDAALAAGGDRLGRLPVPMRWVSNMAAVANDPEVVRAMIADRTGAGAWMPRGFLASYLGSPPAVAPERFDTCPVTLAHPGDDRWTPLDLSLRFLRRMTSVPTEVVVLERCGHLPVESPGRERLEGLLVARLQDAAEAERRGPRLGPEPRRLGIRVDVSSVADALDRPDGPEAR